MGGFGSIWHWVIVLLVIVLLFGAKKIPEVAKGLGSGIKNFKKAMKEDEDEVKSTKEIDSGTTNTTPLKEETAKENKSL